MAAHENQRSKSRRKPMPEGTLLQRKSDRFRTLTRTILRTKLIQGAEVLREIAFGQKELRHFALPIAEYRSISYCFSSTFVGLKAREIDPAKATEDP